MEDAEEQDAVVIVGDLGWIRKDNDEGRYPQDAFARPLNYIEYKVHDTGIDVRLVEGVQRRVCEGVRETQGRFECPERRLDDDADQSGALNIDKRALDKFSEPLSEGTVLARPETQVIVRHDGEPANRSVSVVDVSNGWTDYRRETLSAPVSMDSTNLLTFRLAGDRKRLLEHGKDVVASDQYVEPPDSVIIETASSHILASRGRTVSRSRSSSPDADDT